MFENLRTVLDSIGELTELLLDALSLLCIIAGVIIALVKGIQEKMQSPELHPLHTNFRLLFGGWLVVALEFQLAADIVGTIISPITVHLVQLAAIAVIRTFLNYFLNKELIEESERYKIQLEKKLTKTAEVITV